MKKKLIGNLLALSSPLMVPAAHAVDATPAATDSTAAATTVSTLPNPSSTSNTTTVNETQRGQEQLTEVMVQAKRASLGGGLMSVQDAPKAVSTITRDAILQAPPGANYAQVIESIPGVQSLYTCQPWEVPGEFDVVSMVHVLEHIPHPENFLKQLLTKLRPGGLLIVELPYHVANPFELLIADHCTHFSADTAAALLRRAGFEVVQTADDWVPKELSLVARRLWSAGACHRFSENVTDGDGLRACPTDEAKLRLIKSGDKSPHSKSFAAVAARIGWLARQRMLCSAISISPRKP